jgi:hypothetical protein
VQAGERAEVQTPKVTRDGVEVPRYSPPTMTVVGSVYELTLDGGWDKCFYGKKLGGSDGLHVGPIQIPISSC